jgi:hypothetical protein
MQRVAVRRRTGTQEAARIVVAWAPALQRTAEPDDASHRRDSAALRPGHERVVWRAAASTPSLRAQRSNPESFRRDNIHPVIPARRRSRRRWRCEACDANASHTEPRRIDGRDAAGPSPFEARSRCCAPRLAPQGDGHRVVLVATLDFDLHLQTHLRALAAHFARALLRRLYPPMKEGAGKAGSRLAPIVRYAMSRLRYTAQRVTGQPEHPGLPCAVVLRLMSCSPRGAMHYCPRRLADD